MISTFHTDDTVPVWHIAGTGAMACLWAESLSRAGNLVHLMARHPVPHTAYHAVTVVAAAGVRTERICIEAGTETSPIVRLLVCTKAHDVEAALAARAARIAPGTPVVLVQNGMGFQQRACELLPGARIFCAVTTEGAWLEKPFCVHHAGSGTTVLGAWPLRDPKSSARLAGEIGRGALAVQAVADIEPVLMLKLAVNCAINPLTALHDRPNGALLGEPGLAREFDALCTELEQVFGGLGHPRIASSLRGEAKRVAGATAANRSSMLQDLSAGRRTEIEYITGFLCRSAEAAGIACPLNDALLATIRAREPA